MLFSFHSSASGSVRIGRCRHVGSLSLAVLLLVTACTTPSPRGVVRRDVSSLRDAPASSSAEVDDRHPGAGDVVFMRLPGGLATTHVGPAELSAALSSLWLEAPLRVLDSAGVHVGRKWVLVPTSSLGEASLSDLTRSYNRFCEWRGTPGDCLTLFDDGPRFQADDRRRLALALAVAPALDGARAEVNSILDPGRVLATLSFAMTAYLALLLAPEPVTKGAALVFSVLLWGYLGWEFFDLLRAYLRLHEDAPRASSFAELRRVGEQFASVIGPNSVRILVLVASAAAGEASALASKGANLSSFRHASRVVEHGTGLRLAEAAIGAERVVVSVSESTLHLVLPASVVTMAAKDRHVGASNNNPPEPRQPRAFTSFKAFKRARGKASSGKEWHHIVEKRNAKRFGAEAVHNTENVIELEKSLHDRVSAFYSSIQKEITGSDLTVRMCIEKRSYEAQRQFGLQVIENIRRGTWR